MDSRPFAPRSAGLLWRAGADDALVVVSDAPGICDTLSSGAWPRGKTVLRALLKHNGRELRDAPWDKGTYPLRAPNTPRSKRAPRDAKNVALLVLDETCTPTQRLSPTEGSVTLLGPPARLGGTMRVAVDLRFGADQLAGTVEATVCAQPNRAPTACR